MEDMALEDMPTKYKRQVCICFNNFFFKEQYFAYYEMVPREKWLTYLDSGHTENTGSKLCFVTPAA